MKLQFVKINPSYLDKVVSYNSNLPECGHNEGQFYNIVSERIIDLLSNNKNLRFTFNYNYFDSSQFKLLIVCKEESKKITIIFDTYEDAIIITEILEITVKLLKDKRSNFLFNYLDFKTLLFCNYGAFNNSEDRIEMVFFVMDVMSGDFLNKQFILNKYIDIAYHKKNEILNNLFIIPNPIHDEKFHRKIDLRFLLSAGLSVMAHEVLFSYFMLRDSDKKTDPNSFFKNELEKYWLLLLKAIKK